MPMSGRLNQYFSLSHKQHEDRLDPKFWNPALKQPRSQAPELWPEFAQQADLYTCLYVADVGGDRQFISIVPMKGAERIFRQSCSPTREQYAYKSPGSSEAGSAQGCLLWACQSATGHRSVMALLQVTRLLKLDPITLIVTALVAGAALGVQDTASEMVKDAYASLKALVRRRLGNDPGAEIVLARHERAPETWQAPLMAELARTGADGDGDLLAAAKALLDLVGGAEAAGKYAVDVRGAQGVQIGDHNRQDNVFNAPGDGAGRR